MIKICQTIHFGEKVDQLYVLVSLELNVIETNRFFLQKEGVNEIVLRYNKEPNRMENPQNGGHHSGSCLPCSSTHPGGLSQPHGHHIYLQTITLSQ